jgi:cell pole-organizing protein PopZ
MAEIAAALRKLLENSEDLSSLPQLVAKVELLEAAETTYQERITKLQEINRSYLAQIPVPTDKTKEAPPAPKEPTMDDVKNYLVQSLTGGNK